MADRKTALVISAHSADFVWRSGGAIALHVEFLAGWDAVAIAALLDRLDAHYRGERYRVSPELRRRTWAAPPAR